MPGKSVPLGLSFFIRIFTVRVLDLPSTIGAMFSIWPSNSTPGYVSTVTFAFCPNATLLISFSITPISAMTVDVSYNEAILILDVTNSPTSTSLVPITPFMGE